MAPRDPSLAFSSCTEGSSSSTLDVSISTDTDGPVTDDAPITATLGCSKSSNARTGIASLGLAIVEELATGSPIALAPSKLVALIYTTMSVVGVAVTSGLLTAKLIDGCGTMSNTTRRSKSN
ncbi:hypothetical protein GUJ93_ZPchr0010g11274 [Zizania palustris]|uniref:Uncharacterized protein n=1 Tax=Zizania palustris TaxID=103762 RepID=A0A8J5TIL3_ZIZPA|nr:hypothetical protein GUJ93_ZPchr0010g11274 [Zizania palustris]